MKNMLKLTGLAALILFSSTFAKASVWPTTQQWSPEVEAQYQDWVKENWKVTFFEEDGPLQGVKLDCADTVYSMRMFYSYKNGLPFAVRSPGSRSLISNDMSRFDNITDPAKRFRAFAINIYNMMATETLPEDSYALALNRDAVHSGVFMRSDKASHHSWTVQNISVAGEPHLLFASRPALTVLLSQSSFPSMKFLWGHEGPGPAYKEDTVALQTIGTPDLGVGFRMYRYPQDLLKPEAQVPGFSMDQFQMKEADWSIVARKKIAMRAETDEETAQRVLSDACDEATARVSFVQIAINKLAAGHNQCMSAQDFDDYSTPSKDSRGISTFRNMMAAYKSHNKGLTPTTRAMFGAIVAGTDDGSFCPQQITPDVKLTLGQVAKLYVNHKISANPNDSILARWGLAPSPSPLAASCRDYNSAPVVAAALPGDQPTASAVEPQAPAIQ